MYTVFRLRRIPVCRSVVSVCHVVSISVLSCVISDPALRATTSVSKVYSIEKTVMGSAQDDLTGRLKHPCFVKSCLPNT